MNPTFIVPPSGRLLPDPPRSFAKRGLFEICFARRRMIARNPEVMHARLGLGAAIL
jgi:hypothetical protein